MKIIADEIDEEEVSLQLAEEGDWDPEVEESEPHVIERRRHEVKELRKWMLYLC